MHKDVDLTEKGYFQDYKLPNYNHRPIRKRVPWCRNVDNGVFFARYKNKLNSFLNESYYIYDHDDFDFVNDFDYLETGTFSIEFNNDNINTILIKCVGKKEYANYLQKLNIKGTLDYDAIIINNFIYSENGSKIEFNVLDYKDGETIELKNSETNSIIKLRAIKSTSQRPLGLENNGEVPIIIVSDETFDKIYMCFCNLFSDKKL